MARMLICLLLLISPALAEECEKGALYEAMDISGNRHVLQIQGFASPYIFEMYSKGQKQWSITAEQGCSNGIDFCWVGIPDNRDELVDIAAEAVWEEDKPLYMVFAHLRQTLARSYRDEESFEVKAKWHTNRPDNAQEAQILPVNVYKFKSCQ